MSELSDSDLRSELIACGFNAGPVTGTTRKIYEKKLEAFRKGVNGVPGSDKKATKAQTKTVSKSTPLKNNTASIALPSLSTTPLSAKKKGRKVQLTDTESDNELELTLASDKGSPTSTRRTNNKRVEPQFIAPQSAYVLPATEVEYSPPRSTIKRTPTPPRTGSSSLPKRTPMRQTVDSSYSPRGSSSGNKTSGLSFDYGQSERYDDEDEGNDDDHLETSCILPPDKRFDPFRSSIGRLSTTKGDYSRSSYGSGGARQSGYRSFGSATKHKDSPMDRICRISQNAWGFFSRPANSSTPCTNDVVGKRSTVIDSPRYAQYSKYTPSGSKSSGRHVDTASDSATDVSGWIVTIVLVLLASLAIAYFFTANPKTIEDGRKVITGAASDAIKFAYNYAILPVFTLAIVVTLGFGGYHAYNYHLVQKEEKKKMVMKLVERITDVIRDSQSEGIAEYHVRDLLMPPTKRTKEDWKLWKEAADFINLEDSRVRTEVRLIDGAECNVWVWVPIAKQKWQGTALGEPSLSQNIPSRALTRCIKLRGINFTDRQHEKEELRTELLHKLGLVIPLHMGFVVGPLESIVYVMLKDLQDAKRAFSAFHSHWFNGSLITAKYVRDERYMDRFPELTHPR